MFVSLHIDTAMRLPLERSKDADDITCIASLTPRNQLTSFGRAVIPDAERPKCACDLGGLFAALVDWQLHTTCAGHPPCRGGPR